MVYTGVVPKTAPVSTVSQIKLILLDQVSSSTAVYNAVSSFKSPEKIYWFDPQSWFRSTNQYELIEAAGGNKLFHSCKTKLWHPDWKYEAYAEVSENHKHTKPNNGISYIVDYVIQAESMKTIQFRSIS